VVTLDDLAGLDLFLWHGNGPKASVLMGCNQSTISRRVQRCSEVFGLRLKRREGEWVITSRQDLLLTMEREIHQVARLLGQAPLRLEGFPVGAAPLIKPSPPGWCVGSLDMLGTSPLTLLRDRVIDAWLTDAADDIPDSLDFPIIVWPLARQPVTLMAHPQHPLAGETHLSLTDLKRFPLPMIPEACFPRTHAICAGIGLGTLPIRKRRYDTTCGKARLRIRCPWPSPHRCTTGSSPP